MTLAVSIAQSGANNVTMRNRIINGAMMIDQRNAGASVATSSNSSVYTVDRWKAYYSQFSKFTVQQSSTAPSGFTNSLLATSSSAYTVGASEYFLISQILEGLNVADLGWGAAGASTVTLSFWVRSSLTGTFGGAVGNGAGNRSYPFSYTISSANTWEQKTITILGDTAGAWSKDSTTGIALYFSLGSGSSVSGTAGSWAGALYTSATGATSVVGTNGATFYITGVQLEKGTTATAFEQRLYGTELQLCQRYFWNLKRGASGSSVDDAYINGTWVGYSTSQIQLNIAFPVPMRSGPTATFSGTITTQAGTPGTTFEYDSWSGPGGAKGSYISLSGGSGFTGNNAYRAYLNINSQLAFSAEL